MELQNPTDGKSFINYLWVLSRDLITFTLAYRGLLSMATSSWTTFCWTLICSLASQILACTSSWIQHQDKKCSKPLQLRATKPQNWSRWRTPAWRAISTTWGSFYSSWLLRRKPWTTDSCILKIFVYPPLWETRFSSTQSPKRLAQSSSIKARRKIPLIRTVCLCSFNWQCLVALQHPPWDQISSTLSEGSKKLDSDNCKTLCWQQQRWKLVFVGIGISWCFVDEDINQHKDIGKKDGD